jgi:hypothetical protein
MPAKRYSRSNVLFADRQLVRKIQMIKALIFPLSLAPM